MSLSKVLKSLQMKTRFFFRQRMRPISGDDAEERKEFVAKLYLLTGIAFFGYATYKVWEKKVSMPDDFEIKMKKLNIKDNTRIVRYEGFKKVEDYYYKSPESLEKEELNNQSSDSEFATEISQTDYRNF